MSTLNVSNITDGTTTVGTSFVVNGSAKVWINFNGTGTPAINDSLNASSITDIAAGRFVFTFSNALANTNYAPTAISTASNNASANIGSSGITSAPTLKSTTQIRMHIGEADDPADGSTIIHGDLA